MVRQAVARKSLSGDDDALLESAQAEYELVQTVEKFGVARFGNGNHQELSMEHLNLIQRLYDSLAPLREALHPHDVDFCDYETCRRYLVARQWNFSKAEQQLITTLRWRAAEDPAGREFWQSSKCLEDPLAMNMRIVGWDSHGRPLGYTCFREAHDRWDADASNEHVLLLLEATAKLLRTRRKRGWNATADSRQCVWVIDFDGFGFRDQNPRSAIMTAKLLQHHPEMINMVVLLDAPLVFNGLWRLVAPLFDERVRNKIMFVKGKGAANLLQTRLGREAAEWIAMETKDNRNKIPDAKHGNPKRYWIPPKEKDQHDARGMSSYLRSGMYIQTPGDAYEERKANIERHVAIAPYAAQLLYRGCF